MAGDVAREEWTDARLDDLNRRVDDLNRRVDSGFREMHDEFRAVRGEIGALQRMMFQLFGGMMTTMMLGFVGLIVTLAVQG